MEASVRASDVKCVVRSPEANSHSSSAWVIPLLSVATVQCSVPIDAPEPSCSKNHSSRDGIAAATGAAAGASPRRIEAICAVRKPTTQPCCSSIST